MLKATRWWCVGLLTIAALMLARIDAGSAQEVTKPVKPIVEADDAVLRDPLEVLAKEIDKKAMPKHDGTALNRSLRDVINVGVKMFNEPYNDHAGCYRLFQGSLISVRPFVTPELQKKIDSGLANAETMRSYADRAYELRKVLDAIRTALPAGTGAGDKKADGKGAKSEISGKLSFEGKAVKGGYFVTLVGADGKKFSSAIQKDGTFQFKTPITPGEYRVAVEPIPGEPVKGVALPARFSSEGTSGIVITVQGGKSQVDLNLVK